MFTVKLELAKWANHKGRRAAQKKMVTIEERNKTKNLEDSSSSSCGRLRRKKKAIRPCTRADRKDAKAEKETNRLE